MCLASASCFGRKPRLLAAQTKHLLFVGYLKMFFRLVSSL